MICVSSSMTSSWVQSTAPTRAVRGAWRSEPCRPAGVWGWPTILIRPERSGSSRENEATTGRFSATISCRGNAGRKTIIRVRPWAMHDIDAHSRPALVARLASEVPSCGVPWNRCTVPTVREHCNVGIQVECLRARIKPRPCARGDNCILGFRLHARTWWRSVRCAC